MYDVTSRFPLLSVSILVEVLGLGVEPPADLAKLTARHLVVVGIASDTGVFAEVAPTKDSLLTLRLHADLLGQGRNTLHSIVSFLDHVAIATTLVRNSLDVLICACRRR